MAAIASVVLLAGCTAGQAATPASDTSTSQAGDHRTVADDAEQSQPSGEESGDARTDAAAVVTGDPEPAASTEGSTDGADSSAPPAPAPDYASDAGQNIKEFDYPEDPPPADSIVATLCNLNQEYLSSFRTMEDGVPVVDDNLRTMLVAFSDYLSYWDSLRPHYPEAVASIDTAQEIYDLWDQAMLDRDNGEAEAAQAAMVAAEKLLEELPTGEMSDCKTG